MVSVVSVKKCQSLKVCNFLNNGPIFNPQKVLESSWSPLSACSVYKSNLARFQHETRCAREFMVSKSLKTPHCGVYKSNLMRFQHETRCVREFMVSKSLKTPHCGVY